MRMYFIVIFDPYVNKLKCSFGQRYCGDADVIPFHVFYEGF
ncbi:hypothetical protein BR10RB9215_C10388 [Brucella sp. 10RB9215]|nr:hypothetical protein BR10RB9215_C10388 [Brucella sp. 10RB9215]